MPIVRLYNYEPKWLPGEELVLNPRYHSGPAAAMTGAIPLCPFCGIPTIRSKYNTRIEGLPPPDLFDELGDKIPSEDERVEITRWHCHATNCGNPFQTFIKYSENVQ